MEIKDLAGLSEPFNKLIDVFQNGCSWIMEPVQIKRIANAKSKASEIERNDLLKNQLTEFLAINCNKSLQSAREKNQFHNIKNIYANAAQELQMIQNIADTPVNKDWSARFFDYSKDVSDEEAQAIWSKILAGEIAKPGSFNKRTLSILNDLETFEAKWFLESCQFVICDYFIPYDQIKNQYPFKKLQSLIDCGLVNGERCCFYLDPTTITKRESCDVILDTVINGKTLSIKILDENTVNKKISFFGYVLTDAGAQLFGITEAKTNHDFIVNLKEMIEREYKIKTKIIS